MVTRLSNLQIGKKAIIEAVENNDLYLKLMEMGLLPGEEVVVEQIAPLGDPISITIAGYYLSLRKDEAEGVFVVEKID
jgi:ferrous iron transport protein A